METRKGVARTFVYSLYSFFLDNGCF